MITLGFDFQRTDWSYRQRQMDVVGKALRLKNLPRGKLTFGLLIRPKSEVRVVWVGLEKPINTPRSKQDLPRGKNMGWSSVIIFLSVL